MVTAFGDSKTAGDSWQAGLIDLLNTQCANNSTLAEIAVSGATAAYWAANLPGVLASYSGTPTHILVNLGINSEASFEADYATVLDLFHAKWPSAKVYLTHVWGRGYDRTAVNASIDTVRAARSAWAFDGDDERVWLEGGDDGATMTIDGVHYSTAGQAAKAAAVKAAMGY